MTQSVNAVALAGAIATIGWWLLSVFQPNLVVPDAVVAASTAILAYVVAIVVPDTPAQITEAKVELDSKR